MAESGWLLVSFFFAGPVARRDVAGWSHLVATADWINHAILTREEVAGGMRDLSVRGLLEERDERIRLTRRAVRALHAAYGERKRMAVLKLWDVGEELIAAQEKGAKPVRPVSRPLFERAIKAYLDRQTHR